MSTRIPLFRQGYSEEAISRISEDVAEVLRSGRLMFGENTHRLESEFSERMGGHAAVSVNSCTTAMEICLRFFGCDGKEVIVASAGFVTAATSVWRAGGEPVFSDISPDTFQATVETIEAVLTEETCGVIFVHLLGMVFPEIERIRDFCRAKGLFLIEDCAHACGAEWKGAKAGEFGDAGCFSFYPTKIISCGAGGMILTRDEELTAFARSIRVFGRGKDGRVYLEGNDWFLDEFRSVVLRHHLAELDANLTARGRIAERYRRALAGLDGIRLFPEDGRSRFAHYQFPVIFRSGLRRREMQAFLLSEFNVQSKVVYRPVHTEPVFQGRAVRRAESLEVTENMLDHTLVIPLYPLLSEEDQDRVIQAIRAGLAREAPPSPSHG